MAETIFSNPLFIDIILPFLLVFTLTFAILDKTKLLGDGKRQINAIISLVVGIILIAFPFARNVIVRLIPFLVVSLVILFIFMLLYGFISGGKEGAVLNKGLKITLGILAGLAVVVAVLWITGVWDPIYELVVEKGFADKILINVLVLAVIGGAIAIVVTAGKGGSSGSSGGSLSG